MLKERLDQGRAVFGTMVVAMRNPAISLILAEAGFDFFVLDCEHGSFNYETAENIFIAARGAGIVPVVRVPEVRREPVLKLLEAGAQGILAPQVESPEQVRALVDYVRYAPEGKRGVSMTRPHTRYQRVDKRAYMDQANKENLVIAQIESALGVQRIEEILSVPGLDCCLIGPNDLSQSLTNGRNDDPTGLQEAIDRVRAAAAKAGIVSGIHCSDLDDVLRWKTRGMRLCMWSNDVSLMLARASEGLTKLREAEKDG